MLWTTDLSPSLLVTVNDIVRAIDNKLQVDAVILDFSKAFDKVAHKLLLYKLDYYGLEEFIKLVYFIFTEQVSRSGSEGHKFILM